ncbi:MAG: hypothetical protein ACI8ZF_000141 [Candidatus Midichloriaceae bacterium]|jgi:hypothetical protein
MLRDNFDTQKNNLVTCLESNSYFPLSNEDIESISDSLPKGHSNFRGAMISMIQDEMHKGLGCYLASNNIENDLQQLIINTTAFKKVIDNEANCITKYFGDKPSEIKSNKHILEFEFLKMETVYYASDEEDQQIEGILDHALNKHYLNIFNYSGYNFDIYFEDIEIEQWCLDLSTDKADLYLF